MAKFDFLSARGFVLPLSDNPYFWLTNIDGQTQFSSAISSTVNGGIDGDTVNNIVANPRPIILDLTIKSGVNVESAKRYILRYVKAKQTAFLRWEQENKTLIIAGTVESVEMPRWTNQAIMQITLHCEQPYWEDIDYMVQTISEALDLHYFTESPQDMLYFPESGIAIGEYDTTRTKTFNNEGDVSIGVEITINAIDTVTNPIIYDMYGEFFGVGYGTGSKQLILEPGDIVTITTLKGEKAVKLNGVNIFDKIKPQSTWLQLESGENLFSINSDDESTTNMYFNMSYKQRYI